MPRFNVKINVNIDIATSICAESAVAIETGFALGGIDSVTLTQIKEEFCNTINKMSEDEFTVYSVVEVKE